MSTVNPFASVCLVKGRSMVYTKSMPSTVLPPRTSVRDEPGARWLMLALLATGEFLGMTLWFSATAVTPALVAEFHLSTGQAAWLTMAVQGGFVLGTLVSALLNLPYLLATRRLFAVGCVLGAIATAGVT